jgi:hypothetical protein
MVIDLVDSIRGGLPCLRLHTMLIA